MKDFSRSVQRPARLLVGVAAALLLLLVLAAAATGAPAAAPGVAAPSGAVDLRSETWSHVTYLPLAPLDYYAGPSIFGVELPAIALNQPGAALTLTAGASVYWARWRLPWTYVEPISTTPATYRWQYFDLSVRAATQAGLHLILNIDSNPKWAALFASGPISATARFTSFVQAAVERYDGDGNGDAAGSPVADYWEFYNEPDGGSLLEARNGTGSYWGKNPDSYAQMLCDVYPVVKAANPRGQVLFGGLAYDNFDDQGDPPGPFVRSFLDDVLARIQVISPGQPCFDYLNFHYYPAFRSQWEPYGPGLVGKMNYMRGKLQNHNMGNIPILVTEFGWHSNPIPGNPNTGSPEMQADYVPKLYAEALAANPKLAIWFSWFDPGSTGFDNGLINPDLTPKPAYYAFATAASRLQAAKYLRTLSAAELGSSHLEGYLVTRSTRGRLQQNYVLWSNDAYDSTATYAVSLSASQVRPVDVYGQAGPIINDADDGRLDGRVTAQIGVHPKYLEVFP